MNSSALSCFAARAWRSGCLAVALAVAVSAAWGQDKAPSPLQVAVWAASCNACHGPDGRAEGTGLSLRNRSADDLLGKLMGFKSGQLKATMMHQHAKGYSDDELRHIAQHFSSLK